jgi:3-methyladenine DNA glycosylase AlkD
MTTPDIESIEVKGLAADIDARLRALPSLKVENVRDVRREFSKRLANAHAGVLIGLALELLESPNFEYRFVAYELLCHHRAALRSLGERELEQLGRGIDSWEDVDTFACYLAGPAWREHQVPDALIGRWAHSEDRWWRRAALVSTVVLKNKARGGRGDTARTLQVCRVLVGDRDDMVVKAMSWALRELSKRDPQAVHEFLAEQQGTLAARAVREVRNKLSTGLKNPRR